MSTTLSEGIKWALIELTINSFFIIIIIYRLIFMIFNIRARLGKSSGDNNSELRRNMNELILKENLLLKIIYGMEFMG